ncbi:sucrose-6-phosphate hydrolase [Niallia alba]|uniref:sucrose-6-phosphate hydrolase n=1 Tax=Niallia alba TaxID=2729105 RepID=UPI002E24A265|nr:sucrose-6-phosphate hydrolase [Niallia alba]
MKWTDEARYRPYEKWNTEYKRMLERKVKEAKWRLDFHIQPETGLLNDPNGFTFFNNQWHLFYQSFPFGPVHGLKSWYHLVSDDLIHWQPEGIAIKPDTDYDSHGVYSGSALPIGDKLLLAYTGNVRDEAWQRGSYQMGAWMNQEGHITKIEKPLINQRPERITEHFRDPQVIKYLDRYLMFIGAQTTNNQGEVLVYQSDNLLDWKLNGSLDFNQESMGYMIECPSLIFLDEQPVLIFCPQGLDKKVANYQNIYPNFYIVGESFDYETCKINHVQDLTLLDEGFDLYATQAFNAPDGRCLSIGWIGLPEMEYPTFKDGWAHCLSLVKELKLINGELYQYPVTEMKKLRKDKQKVVINDKMITLEETKNSYDLQIRVPSNSKGHIELFGNKDRDHFLCLEYDTINGKLKLDRSRTFNPINLNYGEERSTDLKKNEELLLSIFVDQSVCEIFINNGQKVMTTTYYPEQGQNNVYVEGDKECLITYFPFSKTN